MAPDLDSILRDFKYRRPGRAFSFLLLIVLIWIHHHHHWVYTYLVFATSCSEALVREKPRKYLHVHVALTSMLNQSRPHVDDISTKRSVLGSVAAGFQMIDVFFSFPLCGSSAHSAYLGTYLGPFPLQGLIAFRPIDFQQMKTHRYVLGFDGLGPVGAGFPHYTIT